MKFDLSINSKALQIIAENKREKQYLRDCKRANICSDCGNVLSVRTYDQFTKKERDSNISQIFECSENKEHSKRMRHHKQYDDDGDY